MIAHIQNQGRPNMTTKIDGETLLAVHAIVGRQDGEVRLDLGTGVVYDIGQDVEASACPLHEGANEGVAEGSGRQLVMFQDGGDVEVEPPCPGVEPDSPPKSAPVEEQPPTTEEFEGQVIGVDLAAVRVHLKKGQKRLFGALPEDVPTLRMLQCRGRRCKFTVKMPDRVVIAIAPMPELELQPPCPAELAWLAK